MAIRKPFEKIKENNVSLETIISKGASVMQDNKDKETKDYVFLNLRVPLSLLSEVNAAVEKRVGISRSGWILEAMQEKLQEAE